MCTQPCAATRRLQPSTRRHRFHLPVVGRAEVVEILVGAVLSYLIARDQRKFPQKEEQILQWHAPCKTISRDQRLMISRDQRLMEVDMAGTEKDAKVGCSSGACSCKEASVDVRGKKFCSTTGADGKKPCGCGHPPCKPKPK